MRPTLYILAGICLYFASNKRTNARYLLLKIEEKEEFPKQDFQYENGTQWPISGRYLVANHRNRHLVNHESCGLSKDVGYRGKSGRTMIVGGVPVKSIKEQPWMVLIGPQAHFRNGDVQECQHLDSAGLCERSELKFNCAGSLISDRWVVTAGHCMVDRNGMIDRNQQYKLKLGALKRTDRSQYQLVDSEKAIIHEGIVKHCSDCIAEKNDIGLIRMKQSFDKNKDISPICLPLDESSKILWENMNYRGYEKPTVVGWGATTKEGNYGPFANQLRKLEFPGIKVISNRMCQRVMKRFHGPIIPYMHVCAGGITGKDSCVGDSGGPIMVSKREESRQYLMGVVSWGPTTCGIKNSAGIYSNIAYFNQWILDNIY